jgi:hypothetical protein
MYSVCVSLQETVEWMRFQVLMAMSMKITVCWDFYCEVWWKLTDISEVFTASIIRALMMCSSSVLTNILLVLFLSEHDIARGSPLLGNGSDGQKD